MRKKDVIKFGAGPQADFLPDKLRNKKADLRTERSLLTALIVSVVASFCLYLLASVIAFAGQGFLANERLQVSEILAEQAKYKDVRELVSQIEKIEQYRSLVTASEILWEPFLMELRGTLPQGSEIQSIEVAALSSSQNEVATEVPLAKNSVASVTLRVMLPDLASLEIWLIRITNISGYSDSTLNSVSVTEAGYVADVTLNLGKEAYSQRYLSQQGPDTKDGAEKVMNSGGN